MQAATPPALRHDLQRDCKSDLQGVGVPAGTQVKETPMCIMIKKSVVDQICRRWCFPQTVRKANSHHGERGHFALGGGQAGGEAQKTTWLQAWQ